MSFGKPKKGSQITIIALLLMVLAVGGVLALVILTQTVPSSNPAPAAIITSTCPTLTLSNPTPALGSGTERLSCGAGAAFTSIGGTVSASFSLTGTGYTNLQYVSHSATDCTTAIPVPTTSTTVTAGSYDYCAVYTSTSGMSLGTFTITWNQVGP